jgi:hypothetical protein
MTNSDQQQLQGTFALLAACTSQMVATTSVGAVCSTLLSTALCAAEAIEALTDPARDAFAPQGFLPKAAPDMRPQRLLLTQSLLTWHGSSKHLKAAA